MIYIFVNRIEFKEVSYSLKENLNQYGLNTQLTSHFDYNNQDKDLYIIFGSQHIIDTFPKKYMIYQLEHSNVSIIENNQLEEQNYKIFNRKYIEILQNAIIVLEFSNNNISFYNKINTQLTPKIKSFYTPICYSSYLSQYKQYLKSHHLDNLQEVDKNIDILFIGNINNRIQNILKTLINLGYRVEYHNYSNNILDKIIKSKIILNIHYYEESLLETQNIIYLLSNKSFIISENSADKIEDSKFDNCLILCEYDKIVNTCQIWLDNYKHKMQDIYNITNFGFETIQKEKFKDYFDISILKDYNETIKLSNAKSKRNKKKLNRKLNIHIPTDIKEAETEMTTDNHYILKSIEIDEKDLPFVSIITPTRNRRKLFSIAIRNYLEFNYPRNKLEWIIIDDGDEDLTDMLPNNDKNIHYYHLENNKDENKIFIGKKRNMGIEKSNFPYIVFMDDDDYYTPESIIARIKTMIKYNVRCVGCRTVGNYDLIHNYSRIASNGKDYLCEASLSFHRTFWEERQFKNSDKHGEYLYFLHHRQNECISIPFQFIMIALHHGNNTTGDKKLVDNKQDDSLLDILNDEEQIYLQSFKKYICSKM